ncbi:hypothetical protein RIF29_10984 [Crotalaria pallida]|uniref:Uncharacterized protein n=1 Tax=Crotalaria pallida TaxID=3830 RepID=A0AAN9FTG4_CROPI
MTSHSPPHPSPSTSSEPRVKSWPFNATNTKSSTNSTNEDLLFRSHKPSSSSFNRRDICVKLCIENDEMKNGGGGGGNG